MSDFRYSPVHCHHLIPNSLSLPLLYQNNYYMKQEDTEGYGMENLLVKMEGNGF